MHPRLTALFVAMLVLAPASVMAQQQYPVLEYYVTDLTGSALYSFEIIDIENLCSYVYEHTGVQMAVLVVNTTHPDDINLYTTKTFQQNGLGQEGKDNGILMVIATDDELWRVEVGYGLEGILPDARVGNLVESFLVPEMGQGNYGTGIYELYLNIGAILMDEYNGGPPKSPYPISFIPLTWMQWFVIIGVMVLLAVLTKGKIFLFIPWIFSRGKIGRGGRSGGGGAGGKW